MPRNKSQARKNKKAAASEPAGGAAAAASPADQLKAKGNAAFKGEQYERAEQLYTEGLALEPENTGLLCNRSAVRARLSKHMGAKEDAEAALKASPGHGKAHLRLGEALEGMLDYRGARAAFRAGLDADADNAQLAAALKRLDELMEELKMTEEKESAGRNPESDKFDLMVKWLQDGGARFPQLFMRYYSEDYRGVHALCKIPNETVCLYVPLSHIMTSDVARASEIGRKLLASDVDLRSKHSYLACYLLEERLRGDDSRWAPYINMLPEKYRNVPINFTEEELSHLAGSFTVEKIADRRVSLVHEYEAIVRAVPEFSRHTAEDFIWARLVVITRIFGLVIDKVKTDGLVPYADMLNHKRPRETRWTFDEGLRGFTITSCQTLQRGAEVFDSYGRKCNSRYFVNYGFALDENEDNEAVIRLALPKMDANYRMKLAVLGGRELSGQREYQVPATYADKKTKGMFSFLRLVAAEGKEIVALPAQPQEELAVPPLTVENEMRVLDLLERACDVSLSGFKRTLDETTELLKQPRDSIEPNVRNCVVMVHGEMSVLHFFKRLAREGRALLAMPWKELKKEAAKHHRGTPLYHYVDGVIAGPAGLKKGK